MKFIFWNSSLGIEMSWTWPRYDSCDRWKTSC